jgi:hypothetical protein
MPAKRKTTTRHSKAHPGFEAEAEHIAHKNHISYARGRAILAAQTRRASASARRKNPRLKNVRGVSRRRR